MFDDLIFACRLLTVDQLSIMPTTCNVILHKNLSNFLSMFNQIIMNYIYDYVAEHRLQVTECYH